MISYYDPGSFHSIKKINDYQSYCTLCCTVIKIDIHSHSTLEGKIYRHIETFKHKEKYNEWMNYNDNLVKYFND